MNVENKYNDFGFWPWNYPRIIKKYNHIQFYLYPSLTSNKLNKITKNVNKNKHHKKSKKKKSKSRKSKTDILIIIFTFYRIFFRILFLLEEISKIKSAYGKQDYQPDVKIKIGKNSKQLRKWLKIRQPALSGCLYVYIFTQLSRHTQTFWH